MRTSGLLLSLLFVVGIARSSDAQSSFTGTNWRGWSYEIQLLYIVGWIDGRQHGLFRATQEFSPATISQWETSPRIAKFDLCVSAGQLVEGVTRFYDDYRNLQIGIRSAVGIVIDEATGRKHWTDDELMRIREREATAKRTNP